MLVVGLLAIILRFALPVDSHVDLEIGPDQSLEVAWYRGDLTICGGVLV